MAKSSPWLVALSLLAAFAVWAETINIEKALQAQYQIVSERPTDATAHNDLGNLLSLTGRSGEAEAAYRRAKELNPVDPSTRFNLGLLLQQAGRLEDANEEYYALLEIEPTNAWAHYQLGIVAHDQGKIKQAKELYARSFALDPTLSFSRHNPHVIDNSLATEALLLSSRYMSNPTARVPRQYAEAARIAELMLEEKAEQEAMADAGEKIEEGEGLEREEPPTPSRELLEDEEDDFSKEDEEMSSRVLTNEDLEGLSQVGQAGKRNARRGAKGKGSSSRYSSGRNSGRATSGESAREQDPRSRYRPRSSSSRNKALENEREENRGFSTIGQVQTLQPANPAGRGNSGRRPEVGSPRRGGASVVTPARPSSGRDEGRSGGVSETEPFRPGTGSTAGLRLELLDGDEAVGP